MGINHLEEKLEKKSILITGASKGIGKAIAELLATYRMRMGLLARSEKLLKGLVEKINSAGSKALILKADLRERQAIEDAVAEFKGKFGVPDFPSKNVLSDGVKEAWNNLKTKPCLSCGYVGEVEINLLLSLSMRNIWEAACYYFRK